MIRQSLENRMRSDPVQLRNFWMNVFDGAFFALALGLASQQTVLPVFVRRLGGGNIAVGLIPVLWTAGFNFPQIFIARHLQRFAKRKPIFLRTAFVQRVPWLLLAFLSFFVVDVVSPSVAVVSFLALFALSAVAGSINFPIWFDLIAKLTPVGLRGRLLATRNLFGGILGILGGWVVERILSAVEAPASFGVLFLLAVLAMMGSYVFLLFLKEERASAVAATVPRRMYMRGISMILRRDVNFRNFLVSDALLIMATMASAFYAVSAVEKFNLPDWYAGTFTMVFMGATIGANLLFGVLADRRGHRITQMLAAASAALSCTLAVVAPTVEYTYAVFILSACTVSLTGISRIPFVAEMCSEADRPTYVAVTNMLTSPFVLFGVAAGWLADRWGYDVVFISAGAFALLSFVWWLRRVKEPRHVQSAPALMPVH